MKPSILSSNNWRQTSQNDADPRKRPTISILSSRSSLPMFSSRPGPQNYHNSMSSSIISSDKHNGGLFGGNGSSHGHDGLGHGHNQSSGGSYSHQNTIDLTGSSNSNFSHHNVNGHTNHNSAQNYGHNMNQHVNNHGHSQNGPGLHSNAFTSQHHSQMNSHLPNSIHSNHGVGLQPFTAPTRQPGTGFSKSIYEGTISTDTGFSGPGTIAAAEEAKRQKNEQQRAELLASINSIDSEISQIDKELQMYQSKFKTLKERIEEYEEERNEENEGDKAEDLNLSSIAESTCTGRSSGGGGGRVRQMSATSATGMGLIGHSQGMGSSIGSASGNIFSSMDGMPLDDMTTNAATCASSITDPQGPPNQDMHILPTDQDPNLLNPEASTCNATGSISSESTIPTFKPNEKTLNDKRSEFLKKKERVYNKIGKPRSKFEWQKILFANRKTAKESHNKLLDRFGPAYKFPKYMQPCDIPNYYKVLLDTKKNMGNLVQFLARKKRAEYKRHKYMAMSYREKQSQYMSQLRAYEEKSKGLEFSKKNFFENFRNSFVLLIPKRHIDKK